MVGQVSHSRRGRRVAAIQQKDAARQRRAAVRPAADRELVQSRAAAFECAEADFACHARCVPFSRSVAMVSANAYGGIWHLMGVFLGQSMTYGFHWGLWNSIRIIIFPCAGKIKSRVKFYRVA